MNGRSQVHIFWGAPISSLEMTVPQESTSLPSTADPWKKVQLFLHLKNEDYKHTLEYDQVTYAVGSTNSVNKSADVEDNKTQTLKSQTIHSFGMSVKNNSEEKRYQKLFSEEHKDQSNKCDQNFQNNSFQLDHKYETLPNLEYDTKQINVGQGTTETKCISTEYHEIGNKNLKLFSSDRLEKPTSVEAEVSNLKVSTDTEFLSIMTSSQVAFLAQREYERQNPINKEAINLEIESKANCEKIRGTEENLIQPKEDLADYESEQIQADSLELFSPVCPETKSCHSHRKSDKDLKGNTASRQVFSVEDKLPPNEIYIESCNSGILASQINTFHKSSGKRSCTSRDKMGLSKVKSKVLPVAKKFKLISNVRDSTVVVNQRKMCGLKGIKKTALVKDCYSENQKYNCLVMVLSPCHVKEITIKSGPNSGTKVPLATIVVTDQSEIQKKVLLWRTAAFWALTLFIGDIILLTGEVIMVHWSCILSDYVFPSPLPQTHSL